MVEFVLFSILGILPFDSFMNTLMKIGVGGCLLSLHRRIL